MMAFRAVMDVSRRLPLARWAPLPLRLIAGYGFVAAVLLGAFISIVSIPLAAVLLVAMFTVHLPFGFSSVKLVAVTAAGPQFGKPGYEVNLLYIACLLTLAVGGAGPLAVDSLLGRRPSSAVGGQDPE